jgi:Cu/Ag efflux protein CusF
VLLLIAVLSTGSLLAGAKTKRLVGTVKSIGTDSVTIETASHQTRTIKITSATKFFKSKKASSLSEMKTGDRVEFHVTSSSATPAANTSSATTASADAAASTSTQKDTLSLGLGFTAVQACW